MIYRPMFLALVVLMALSTMVQAQTPVFDALKKEFDNKKVFKSEYQHTYRDSYTEETITSAGQIWIGKNEYKLVSDDQTIVVDGETSSIYDAFKNRVIVSFYEEEADDLAPSRTLNGVDSTYTVTERRDGDLTRISMTSEDDFAIYPSIEIWVAQNGRPIRITAVDTAENETTIEFGRSSFIPFNSDEFKLNYPADAEIIDMRIE